MHLAGVDDSKVAAISSLLKGPVGLYDSLVMTADVRASWRDVRSGQARGR